MGDTGQTRLHRAGVAGGIEHHVKAFVLSGGQGGMPVGKAKAFGLGQPVRRDVQQMNLGTAQLGELGCL